jgi:hypothetical protein
MSTWRACVVGVSLALVASLAWAATPAEKAARDRRKRPPPVVAPAPPPDDWPDLTDVLQPGRVLTLRAGVLRAPADHPVQPPQETVCVVDEQKQAAGSTWMHMTCAPDLPREANSPWSTGCYLRDDQGTWRLPRCPAQADGSGSAVLVLPAHSPRLMARFLDLGAHPVSTRQFDWLGQIHQATCLVRDVQMREESCFIAKLGLVWRASRWRVVPRGEAEWGLSLTNLVEGGPVTPGAPHLKFADDASARCEMAPDCSVFGLCRRVEGQCVALVDEDCRGAEVCDRWGHCHAGAGRCTVQSDADCQTSSGCTHDGRCIAKGGVCVATAGTCDTSAICRESARCTLVDGRCLLTSDADCMRSLGCAQEGRCHLADQQCLARDDADCRATEACVLEKRCAAREGFCVAAPAVPAAEAGVRD